MINGGVFESYLGSHWAWIGLCLSLCLISVVGHNEVRLRKLALVWKWSSLSTSLYYCVWVSSLWLHILNKTFSSSGGTYSPGSGHCAGRFAWLVKFRAFSFIAISMCWYFVHFCGGQSPHCVLVHMLDCSEHSYQIHRVRVHFSGPGSVGHLQLIHCSHGTFTEPGIMESSQEIRRASGYSWRVWHIRRQQNPWRWWLVR